MQEKKSLLAKARKKVGFRDLNPSSEKSFGQTVIL